MLNTILSRAKKQTICNVCSSSLPQDIHIRIFLSLLLIWLPYYYHHHYHHSNPRPSQTAPRPTLPCPLHQDPTTSTLSRRPCFSHPSPAHCAISMPNLLSPSLILTSLLTWLPICTQAHMQMSSPYPLRSPLDPDIPWYEKDYDMTTPLFADGSNFACKHYQTDDDSYAIKATYVAGGTYQMSVAGTASHKGGSCQLSLSYDNGHSFKVIKSIIGGCPLSNTYSFTVPENAPSSESVLFSWSWFNIVGNREMYQNCARVKIISGPNQRFKRELSTKRQYSPLTQLPDMFVCNVNNGCKTIEQREVVFPDPGTDVSYGQNEITPDPGPGFVITGSSSSTTTVSMATTGTTSLTSAGTTGATTTG